LKTTFARLDKAVVVRQVQVRGLEQVRVDKIDCSADHSLCGLRACVRSFSL
jgi:hypothetical protein